MNFTKRDCALPEHDARDDAREKERLAGADGEAACVDGETACVDCEAATADRDATRAEGEAEGVDGEEARFDVKETLPAGERRGCGKTGRYRQEREEVRLAGRDVSREIGKQ